MREKVPMLRHSDIWRAIDRLAREHGYSPSGLARRAGLDPTTFNRSKRVTREGKQRWPSTESIGKILLATGASLDEFVSYINGREASGVFRHIPLLAIPPRAGTAPFDETGKPVGEGWDEIPFPNLADPGAFALEISGDAMAPVYRDGDVVVVSPQAGVRRGDRVVLLVRSGEIAIAQLRRRSARRVDIAGLDGADERSVAVEDTLWMFRIVWVSQ
jgi:phage repressor protein C with HTH and peptisase S24 domain